MASTEVDWILFENIFEHFLVAVILEISIFIENADANIFPYVM